MRRHLVVPYPRSNSSVRVRGLHWIDRLIADGAMARDGVDVHGPGFVRRRVPAGEPVLLLRNAARLSRGGRERRLLSAASPGVYDLDDGLPWDDGGLPGLGRWWKRPFPRDLIARRAAQAADRVIAGNETIAEWAGEWCRDVVVVPTCVEPSDYRPRRTVERSVPPVIGWIGSPATERYLWSITDALVEVNRITGASLEIVSGDGPLPAPLSSFARRRRWTLDASFWIGAWDVGLMPLADGVYERAKCGYKLLQYAASAVPAVASPVGVNATLLTQMDGIAALRSVDWVDGIVTLLAEPSQRRQRRAEAGLATARAFSYEVWQPLWRDAAGW